MDTDTNNDTPPEWKKRKGFFPTIVATGLFGLALFSTDKLSTNTVPTTTMSQSVIRGSETNAGWSNFLTQWTENTPEKNAIVIASSTCLKSNNGPLEALSTHVNQYYCTVSSDLMPGWPTGPLCGKCFELKYNGGSALWGGVPDGARAGKATIQVTNSMGPDGTNHFDCLGDVVKQVTGMDHGDLMPIEFKIVSCPT